MRVCFAGVVLCILRSAIAQPTPEAEQLLHSVSPSVALVLTGSNHGVFSAAGSALIVRSNGILFTALPLVRNGGGVQVRLQNGETYDQVEMIGFDERRGVAALRIPATGLPTVAAQESAQQGDRIWLVSHPGALPWSAVPGTLGSLRLAEELPGAGVGYRVWQFSAAVPPGSTGGALVDAGGRCLGIVVAAGGVGNVNLAIPLDSVMGLASGTARISLNTGYRPAVPARPTAGTSARLVNADPDQILRSARSILVRSRTTFFNPELLAAELRKLPEFKTWGLLIVSEDPAADLVVFVDRPVLTFDFTYSLNHPMTGIVLGSGKVTAIDGVRAGPGLARRVVNHLKGARAKATPVSKPESKPAASGG